MINAPAVLDLGGVGSGKSYALATLAKAGLEVFVIVTEPNGLESILDAFEKEKQPIEKLHWATITPARAKYDDLLAQAKLVSAADQKFLSDQKPTGNRGKSKWIDFITCCANFVDERTGKSFGSIDSLGPDCAVVFDSLSGINIMAMDLVIGDKVSANPGEWGIAMKTVEKFIYTTTSSLKATLVITAHMEKELNELTGANQIMVSTLGKKLAPTIPRFFSEVIMSYREGDKFFWSTSAMNVDLKNRALPVSPKIDPDYGPIIRRYRERLAFAQSATQKTGT